MINYTNKLQRNEEAKGIGGSGTFIIYAVWESTAQLKKAMLLYYLLCYFI